jgi:Protein kinase domain
MAVLQPGQSFGPYRLGERISRGGMGEVWRAVKSGEGGWSKSIALKLILPSLDEERFAAMFLAEARIAAALDHANIVPVFNFGREGQLLYIEMEQVLGQDLRRVLERAHGPLPLPLALFVVAEALKGLAYAHERGVIHRDIKPHNTLCSYEGQVKLTDFGIAKVAETGAGVTHSDVKGTAGYIAPELLEGAPASVRSDLFAIGLVFWECLTGKKLFDGASEAERLKKTFDCRVPPLRQVVPDAPAAAEELLVRLLAREPSARYTSAREALAAVLAAPGGRDASSEEMKQLMTRLFPAEARSAASASLRGSRSGGTPTPVGELAPARSRRGWIVGALALVAITGVGVALARRPPARTLAKPPPAPEPVKPAPMPMPPVPPAPERSSVVLEVTPPDVQLWVGGRLVTGSSPFALAEVPRGQKLTVRVERDGFQPYQGAVLVDAPVVRVPIVLTPAPHEHHAHHKKGSEAPQNEAPPAAAPAPRPKTGHDEDGTMVPPPP